MMAIQALFFVALKATKAIDAAPDQDLASSAERSATRRL
jgi:hypothetical protein